MYRSRARCGLFALCGLMACLLTGCVANENEHFLIESPEPGRKTVRLGGMVTDQLVCLWEFNEHQADETLQMLRDLTENVPIHIDGGGLRDFPVSAQEVWEAAIAPGQQAGFDQALGMVASHISFRSLVVELQNPPGSLRSGPDIRWTWGRRDFVGAPLQYADDQKTPLPRIRVADDGGKLVQAGSGDPFIPWGVNYDRDRHGNLLDEYWTEDWPTVEQDFAEMDRLGINSVRIHLQYGKLMKGPKQPDLAALDQLRKLVRLAEQKGIYLDITGLACYHLEHIPDWYHVELDEAVHWEHQAYFWATVARTCAGSPAVLCYDLMNEPVVGGFQPADENPWLVNPPSGNRYLTQRIALDLNGRSQKQIARAWIDKMVDTIRQHDPDTLITIGVNPRAGGLDATDRPLFYDPRVGEKLDFVSLHVQTDEPGGSANAIDDVLDGMLLYSQLGKPLLLEETGGPRRGIAALEKLLRGSLDQADGWMGRYRGETIRESVARRDLAGALLAGYLEMWVRLGPGFQKAARPAGGPADAGRRRR